MPDIPSSTVTFVRAVDAIGAAVDAWQEVTFG